MFLLVFGILTQLYDLQQNQMELLLQVTLWRGLPQQILGIILLLSVVEHLSICL